MLKILSIGNSFSQDATRYLQPIAVSAGIEDFFVRNCYIGGCSLERHVNCILTGEEAYQYQENAQMLEMISVEDASKASACKIRVFAPYFLPYSSRFSQSRAVMESSFSLCTQTTVHKEKTACVSCQRSIVKNISVPHRKYNSLFARESWRSVSTV